MDSQILNHQADPKPQTQPKYTITQGELDVIRRNYRRVVELSNMTDSEEKYHTINRLLTPIFEDLSVVVQSAQEVKGGVAATTKEKEGTLEISLKELNEVREIWLDVCAFQQTLQKIDSWDDTFNDLVRLHRPIYDRFTQLLMGEPEWDGRIRKAERGGGQ